ncbi:Guanine nucleotide-binding protein subunit beta-2, partial [Orchesella cincta]
FETSRVRLFGIKAATLQIKRESSNCAPTTDSSTTTVTSNSGSNARSVNNVNSNSGNGSGRICVMSADLSLKIDTPAESIEALAKEAEALKAKLEEERQKLNDVALSTVAQRLENVGQLNIKPRRVLKGHQGKVLCVDWSQEPYTPVITCQLKVRENEMKCFQFSLVPVNDNELLEYSIRSDSGYFGRIQTPYILVCVFKYTIQCLNTCSGLDNKVTVYPLSLEDDATQRKKPVGTHTSYTACCTFLPYSDYQILSGSGDSTCALWDVESGSRLQSFHGHTGDVMSLDLAPQENGNTFVSAGCDRKALIWDMRTGQCVQTFDGHESDINTVKFHPSGDAIATGSDDATCRLYDLRADREIAVYSKESIIFAVNTVDFSHSGRLLFAGYSDYTVNVWDSLKCHRISILYGHDNRVSCLKVSPDGTAFCTASWDSTLRVRKRIQTK